MEIAVGFNSLTTTTHPPNVNLPSSGQQVTARLSARKVSVAGETGSKIPWSGTLQYIQQLWRYGRNAIFPKSEYNSVFRAVLM